MRVRSIARLCVLAVVVLAPAGCTGGPATDELDPQLAPRGTTMTTAKPTRQDLTNQVSLTGTVTLNPTFGIGAPIAGQVRYMQVKAPRSTPTKATTVAYVWAKGKATPVKVPAGATFSGRLTDDRSAVTAGMPIVSAKHAGYALVADIGAEQAYQISDGLATVQAQITNGPGPFACKVLGTIAALPAGTVPPPPAPDPAPDPSATGQVPIMVDPQDVPEGSEPTGMRVVCTAPTSVQLINGASVTLEVITKKVTNVLVLPVEAVAGLHSKGKVEVIKPDGTHEVRDVELGLTDGKVIEIKSGLTEDETVAVPGPNLPPAPPGAEGPPGMRMPR